MTIGKPLLIGLALVVALVVTPLAILAMLDWRLRVEQWVESAIGRDVSIGSLAVRWTWPPALVLEGVQVANAPWAEQPFMVTTDSLLIEPNIGALLRGVVTYQRLELSAPSVHLAQSEEGGANWHFGGDKMSEASRPEGGMFRFEPMPFLHGHEFGALHIAGGSVTYRGSRIASVSALAIHAGPQQVTAEFKLTVGGGEPLAMSATLGSLADLANDAVSYPIWLQALSAASSLTFDGSLARPLEAPQVTGHFSTEGSSLAAAGRLIGIALPATPRFEARGMITAGTSVFAVNDLAGRIGDSVFAGSLHPAETDPSQPVRYQLALSFDKLDLEQITGAADTGGGSQGGVIPDTPIFVPELPWAAMAFQVSAEELDYGSVPLGQAKAEGLFGPDGVTLEAFALDIGGGTVQLSGSASPAVGSGLYLEFTGSLQSIELGAVLQSAGMDQPPIDGALAGSFQGYGRGSTFDELAANLDGRLTLAVDDGHIQRSLIGRISLQLLEMLGSEAADRSADIDCFVADVKMKDGVGDIATLVLKTPQSTIVGEGTIDLGTERLDITLRGESDEFSLFNLDAPIRLHGPLDDIAVSLNTSVPEAVGSLLLGLVTAPITALLPMLERGLGSGSGCAKLARAAGQE